MNHSPIIIIIPNPEMIDDMEDRVKRIERKSPGVSNYI